MYMFEIICYLVVLWFTGMIDLCDEFYLLNWGINPWIYMNWVVWWNSKILYDCTENLWLYLSCDMIWEMWNYGMWLKSVCIRLLMFMVDLSLIYACLTFVKVQGLFRSAIGTAEIWFCKIMQTRWVSIYSMGEFQVRGSMTFNSLGEEILPAWIIWKNTCHEDLVINSLGDQSVASWECTFSSTRRCVRSVSG